MAVFVVMPLLLIVLYAFTDADGAFTFANFRKMCIRDSKEILVYSNCDEVELFVNGVSQGVKRRNSQDYPAAGLRWNWRLRACA